MGPPFPRFGTVACFGWETPRTCSSATSVKPRSCLASVRRCARNCSVRQELLTPRNPFWELPLCIHLWDRTSLGDLGEKFGLEPTGLTWFWKNGFLKTGHNFDEFEWNFPGDLRGIENFLVIFFNGQTSEDDGKKGTRWNHVWYMMYYTLCTTVYVLYDVWLWIYADIAECWWFDDADHDHNHDDASDDDEMIMIIFLLLLFVWNLHGNFCDNSGSQVGYSTTCQRAPQGTLRRRNEIQTLYVKASSRPVNVPDSPRSKPDSGKKNRASGGHKKSFFLLKCTNKHVSLFQNCFQDEQ